MNGLKARVGVALLIAAAATVAGCGQVEPLPAPRSPHALAPTDSEPPGDEASAEADDPATATPDPADPAATTAPAGQAPVVGPQPDPAASPCADRSTGTQVIAALRRDRNLLPAGSTPTMTTGPLCAGSWQYTVMNVPGREALQVVTKGDPGRLSVVTAGTYVCVPEVVSAAPGGILTAAHCR